MGWGLFALCFAGCSGSAAWMPLSSGREWQYLVREADRVIEVRCTERARVGLHNGWQLEGEGGRARMAWVDGELICSEMSAMRFEPPIVLLKPANERSVWSYHGRGMSNTRSAPISMTVAQAPAKLRLGASDRETLLVTLSGRFGDTQIQLKTWFERGEGILRQEQRNGGDLVLSMELVSGK
jgi:hypothetical protein